MGWLSQLFRRVASSDSFEAANPNEAPELPTNALLPYQLLRLHVTAAETILLNDQPVLLANLVKELQAAYKPGMRVFYFRENDYEDSEFAMSVMRCVCELGLPILVPSRYVGSAITELVELQAPDQRGAMEV